MLIQGKLLLDPHQPPTPGYVILEGDRIAEVHDGEPPRTALPAPLGGPGHLITPGFTDAHIHLPQVDAVGVDGLPLMQWLDRAIYPAEAWWGKGGPPYALRQAREGVRRLVREGTCGMAAYLTSHAAASTTVIEFLCSQTPLRFIAGRVAMDRNAPQDLTAEDQARSQLRPTPSATLPPIEGRNGATHAWRSVSANPRFAVACSPELLAEIGWLAQERPGMFIQTHLAESVDECELVRTLFPDAPHYSGVYDRFGLLGPRTLLAHCLHLSKEEWTLIAARRSIVVHCPTANVFLSAGLFHLDEAEAHGVRLALGSDVAAGPDIAMPRVARAMIETAKVRRMTGGAPSNRIRVPGAAEVWDIITRGNAELLGWPNAGRIAPGCRADLLVLRLADSWFDEHLVSRLIYNWRSDLIVARIIGGRVVDPDTM